MAISFSIKFKDRDLLYNQKIKFVERLIDTFDMRQFPLVFAGDDLNSFFKIIRGGRLHRIAGDEQVGRCNTITIGSIPTGEQ